jgi:hypothetical protein
MLVNYPESRPMKCPLNVALAAAALIWGVILAAGTAAGTWEAEQGKPAEVANIATTADIR